MTAERWLNVTAAALRAAPSTESPYCETHGLDGHERSEVPTQYGPMLTFNTDLYCEPGYCMGDDDVSRTIRRVGVWEPVETAAFGALIFGGDVVIDFGGQIGWYSRVTSFYGGSVLAIEGVYEHAAILNYNVPGAHVVRHWVDENSPIISADGAPRIKCVKMDLEGAEVHAMRMISDLLDAELVDNILMEISPVFNDSYPLIIRELFQRGFTAEVCNPYQQFTHDEIDAVVAQAPQVDMMFRRVRA